MSSCELCECKHVDGANVLAIPPHGLGFHARFCSLRESCVLYVHCTLGYAHLGSSARQSNRWHCVRTQLAVILAQGSL